MTKPLAMQYHLEFGWDKAKTPDRLHCPCWRSLHLGDVLCSAREIPMLVLRIFCPKHFISFTMLIQSFPSKFSTHFLI